MIPMIRIPPGEYVVGSFEGRADEQPERLVRTAGFEIDAFFVTTDEFLKTLSPGCSSASPEPDQRRYSFPADDLRRIRRVHPAFSPTSRCTGELPATGIDCERAQLFAGQVGKRLPTEDEWEIAAGRAFGRQGMVHPRPLAVPLPLMNRADALALGLTTPEGLICPVGVAWQWTATQYGWPPGKSQYRRATLAEGYQVVRGGIWSDYDARVSFRSFRDPSRGYSRVGIRCVRDIQ